MTTHDEESPSSAASAGHLPLPPGRVPRFRAWVRGVQRRFGQWVLKMDWGAINSAAADVAGAAKRRETTIDDVVCMRDPKLCAALASLGTSLAAVEGGLNDKLASLPADFDLIGERKGPRGTST